MNEKEKVLTEKILQLYTDIGSNLPDTRHRRVALEKLEECKMWMIEGLNILSVPLVKPTFT